MTEEMPQRKIASFPYAACVVVFVTFSNTLFGYITVRPHLKQMRIYEQSRKNWFSYINNFIFIQFRRYVSFDGVLTLPKNLEKMHKQALKFVARSHSIQTGVKFSKRQQFQKCGTSGTSRHMKVAFFNVTRATGRLIQTTRMCDPAEYDGLFFCKVTWIVQLDKKLALNLTFHSISFSTSPNNCCGGNVAVSNKDVYIGRCSNCSADAFVFCGHSSLFYLYPAYRKVFIGNAAETDTVSKVSISYSVQDVDLVTSLNSHSGFLSPFILSKQINLLFVLIQSQKHQHIILQQKNDQHCAVYDGPGLKSKMITPDNNIFVSSSFQLVVVIVNSSFESKKKFIKYSLKQLQVKYTLDLNNAGDGPHHVISGNTCKFSLSPCLLNIIAQDKLFVNVSVIRAMYEGPISGNCMYGGLSILEKDNHSVSDRLSLCQSQDSSLQQSRNVFSNKGSLLIIIYWYEGYSVVNTTLSISSTKCKAVEMNDCLFKFYCECVQFQKRIFGMCQMMNTEKSKCHSFVKRIAQQFDGNIEFVHNQIYPGKLTIGRMVISLNNSECIVLDLSRKEKHFDEMRERTPKEYLITIGCDMQLMPHLGTEPNLFYKIQVAGRIVHVGLDGIIPEQIEFYGEPDDLYDNKFGQITEKPKSPNYLEIRLLYKRNASVADENIFMTAKVKSPVHKNVFTIFTYLKIQPYGSWFQIVLHKMLEPETHANSNDYLKGSLALAHREWVSLKLGVLDDQVLKWDLYTTTYVDKKVQIFVNMYNMVTNHHLYGLYQLQYYREYHFMQQRQTFFISLPGLPDYWHFYLNLPEVMFFQFEWLKNVYGRYKIHSEQEAKQCKIPLGLQHIYSYCYNFSSATAKQWYFISYLVEHNPLKMNDRSFQFGHKDKLISWNKASELCKHSKGILPKFTSRKDVEEFIVLMKLSKYFPDLEAVYIGLKYALSVEVSSFHISLIGDLMSNCKITE